MQLNTGRSWVISLLCFLVSSGISFAQTGSDKKLFIAPIDSEIILAGTFGEIRPDHFHSGVDISTGSVEGKKVYAAADGYVSRIKISATGFGKAIYLTHKNGYQTVYAHLQRFNDSLENFVKHEQYKRESFEVELFPEANQFVYRQGALIAFSGNTGGSAAPHLHFEIRDAKTEEPLELAEDVLNIKDTIPPEIKSVVIYPLHGYGSVNGSYKPLRIPLMLKQVGIRKMFSPVDTTGISLNGEIGFGLEVFDVEIHDGSELGIKKIVCEVGDSTDYKFTVDRFGFNETRYVKANIDYAEYLTGNKTIVLCYRLPGNNFSPLSKGKLSGISRFNNNTRNVVRFGVFDFSGNKSTAEIKFNSTSEKVRCPDILNNDSALLIQPYKAFKYVTNEIEVKTDKLPAVYDNQRIFISKEKGNEKFFSHIFHIGDAKIPIHNSMSLSILPRGLPSSLRAKALIAKIDSSGNISSVGGNFNCGLVLTEIKTLGSYTITVDTISPLIGDIVTRINQGGFTRKGEKNLKQKILIRVKISDELSGISTYRATVNKKWLLMEYDAKSGMLTGELNFTGSGTKRNFVLTVTDKKGNKSTRKKQLSL